VLVRSCPECFSAHKPTPACPYCGYEYPPKPRTKAEIKAGELEELLIVRKAKKMEEGMCRTYEDFLALGVSRGYAAPAVWARIRIQSRHHR
jgi:DNA repair protein RadD